MFSCRIHGSFKMRDVVLIKRNWSYWRNPKTRLRLSPALSLSCPSFKVSSSFNPCPRVFFTFSTNPWTWNATSSKNRLIYVYIYNYINTCIILIYQIYVIFYIHISIETHNYLYRNSMKLIYSTSIYWAPRLQYLLPNSWPVPQASPERPPSPEHEAWDRSGSGGFKMFEKYVCHFLYHPS